MKKYRYKIPVNGQANTDNYYLFLVKIMYLIFSYRLSNNYCIYRLSKISILTFIFFTKVDNAG